MPIFILECPFYTSGIIFLLFLLFKWSEFKSGMQQNDEEIENDDKFTNYGTANCQCAKKNGQS